MGPAQVVLVAPSPSRIPIAVGFITSHIWFSALLAWTLKAGILKYGGIRLFPG